MISMRICNSIPKLRKLGYSISKLRKLGFGTGAQDILKHQVHVRARGHSTWHSGPTYTRSQHVIIIFCTLSFVRLRKGPYSQMATPDWPVDRSLAMSYWQLASNYTRHFPRRRTHNETTRIPCVPALSHPAPSPQKERLGLAIFHFLYYLRLIGLRSHYYERCDLFPVFYL
jgi:hypothetical protein